MCGLETSERQQLARRLPFSRALSRLRVCNNPKHSYAITDPSKDCDRIMKNQNRDGSSCHPFCVPQHLQGECSTELGDKEIGQVDEKGEATVAHEEPVEKARVLGKKSCLCDRVWLLHNRQRNEDDGRYWGHVSKKAEAG